MIRTLLATTALAALMTTGAMAQDATPVQSTDAPAGSEAPAGDAAAPAAGATTTEAAPTAPAPTAEAPAPVEAQPGAAMPQTFEMAQGYTAVDSDNLASELIDQPVYSSAGDDAEEIGNVTDLVFDEQGSIAAVVIGVGGFLGIGEKSVAVPYDALQFVIAADNTERWVVETTAEALNGAPEFVWEEDEPADEGDAAAEGDAMAPADGGAMAPADPAAAPATN
ncbi:MAG TPA: PRC-barrel domain-containing protein [Devosia sp.]|uniref:PRC-barrel domain-containing protein n=1 Tax=Devosia sp. TaxID=1871048 RepID=UPI002F93FEC7